MEFEKAVESKIRIENEHKSGANWFYWIAGMSILNEIFYQTQVNWNFAIGLGVTQITNALFQNSGMSLIITFIVSGVFVFLGKMAHRGHRWAFITGIIFYSMDGILFIIVKDYVGLGLHVFALFWIYRGMKAYRKLMGINNMQVLKPSEEGMSV